MSSADHVITGKVELGSQYHYHMETQTAVVVPDEGGFKVQSATQWVDRVQAAVAMVMKIPASSVDVSVKRIGGAYGAKTTRPNLIAAACAQWVLRLLGGELADGIYSVALILH